MLGDDALLFVLMAVSDANGERGEGEGGLFIFVLVFYLHLHFYLDV